jgi:hypothetical protein
VRSISKLCIYISEMLALSTTLFKQAIYSIIELNSCQKQHLCEIYLQIKVLE